MQESCFPLDMLGSLFPLSSVYISKISAVAFEHVFVCWKGREKQLMLFKSLKYLTQQTNTCTKLVTVTLKQEVSLRFFIIKRLITFLY